MASDPPVFSPDPGASANARGKNVSCLTLMGPHQEETRCIAEQLAGRLQWGWIDTDRLVEAWFGLSLDAMKTRLGPAGFLAAHEQVLLELNVACLVIAAGSEAVLSPKVVRFLQHQGTLVFLRPPDRIWEQHIQQEFLRGFHLEPGVSGQDLLLEFNGRLPRTADLVLPEGVCSAESAAESILKGLYEHQEPGIEAKQAF